VIVYAYDSRDRIATEKWYDSTADADAQQNCRNTITYTYNVADELEFVYDAYASYDYDYDELGRVTQVTQNLAGLAPSVVAAQDFDAMGRRTDLTLNVGGTADLHNHYGYDHLHRVTQIEQKSQTAGNTVAPKRADLHYNVAGEWTGIARYNDLAATQTVVETAYAFDDIGRFTALTYAKGTSTLPDYGWTYDDAGRLGPQSRRGLHLRQRRQPPDRRQRHVRHRGPRSVRCDSTNAQ